MPPPAHTPSAVKSPLLSSSSTSSSFPSSSLPSSPPPLPASLVPQVDSLERRLQDLQDYQLPQLQDSGNLQSTTRESHEELVKGVRNELAGVRRDLDELKLDVEDLVRVKERQAGFYHLNLLQEQLDQCTKFYRIAVVQSKRQLDALLHYSNRDELFATSGRDSPAPGGDRKANNQSGEDALMSATSDVTEGLRRTLQLLQSEVDRSLVSNELLEQQTSTLSSTTTSYSRLSSLLSTSKSLITSLERADVLDRLLLFVAFSFFVGVCSYIFKKRVVDRGIRVASAVTRVFGSGKGGVKEVRDVVRSEFKKEVSAAAAATAAVVGAVKRAREGVRERLRERNESEEEEEKEGLVESVVEKVREFTSEPVRGRTKSGEPELTSTLTQDREPIAIPSSSSSSSSTRVISTPSSILHTEQLESVSIDESIPSTSFTPVPLPTEPSTPISPEEFEAEEEENSSEYQDEEQDVDEDENLFDQDEEEEIIDLPLSDSPSATSTTAATAPEEPTPTPTAHEIEEPTFTPEPTLEPSPVVEESPELFEEEVLGDDETERAVEQVHEASAEPEIDILPPSTPQPTESTGTTSSSPTTESVSDSPPSPVSTSTDPEPEQTQEEENEEEFEPINPRSEHPPTPRRTPEELSELFNEQPLTTGEDATNDSLNDPNVPSSELDDSSPSSLPNSAGSSDLPSSPTASPSTIEPLPIVSTPSLIIDEPLPLSEHQEHSTTPLDTEDLSPDSIPRLDVEEDGREMETELPMEDVEEAVDESLLDGMMERSFGGMGMGGVGFAGNETFEERVKEGEREKEETSLPVREEESTPTPIMDEESPAAPNEEEFVEVPRPSPSVTPRSEVVVEKQEEIDSSVPPVSSPTSITPSSVPEPTTPPSATTIESTPPAESISPPSASPSVEPLDDFDISTEEQPDLSPSDPLDFAVELDDSITEPLTTHLDIPEEIEPTSVQLPIETTSPSSLETEEQFTTPIPSASWLSASSAAAQQTRLPTPESIVSEEKSLEIPNSIVAAPTPAPVPVQTEDASSLSALPTPDPVETVSPELEEEEQLESIPADPKEQAIPTPLESPEPLAIPTPTPSSYTTPSSTTDVAEPTLLGKEEETNSDQIYPESDIDQPIRTEEADDSVFGDLPVAGTKDEVWGEGGEGSESLSEGNDDEEEEDSFIVPPSSAHVEL